MKHRPRLLNIYKLLNTIIEKQIYFVLDLLC